MNVALYALFPMGAAIVAAIVAIFFQSSGRDRSAVQHLAAGVVSPRLPWN